MQSASILLLGICFSLSVCIVDLFKICCEFMKLAMSSMEVWDGIAMTGPMSEAVIWASLQLHMTPQPGTWFPIMNPTSTHILNFGRGIPFDEAS